MGLVNNITLAVGFSFYETSLETVMRAIDSVKDHVDVIYAIDGKYEEFESEQLLSNSVIREYLKKQPNVVLVDVPNRKEHEKRQRYLDMCNRDMADWLLILDADEYVTPETDWEAVRQHLVELTNHDRSPGIFGVTLKINERAKKEFGYPRLWRCPYLIDYLETHNFWKFRTDGKIYRSSIDWPRIRGIFMKGDDELRSQEYNEKSYQYQLKLMKRESPLKMKYREKAENTKQYNQKDTRLPSGIPVM